ncbi:MAG: DUF4278 domain-containing protein [Nodosilinea sp.]
MKLTYRGVSYDYTPPAVETNATDEGGKFRGVDIRFRTVKKAPVQQPTLDLVYRGVAYQAGNPEIAAPVVEIVETAPVEAPAAPAVATTSNTEDRARMSMMNRHRLVKQRQQSMLTRLATEAGLPEGVALSWNHIQGKVHPSFWATYSRGGATAS